MERKQFTFYRSFYDVARKMPEEDRGKMLYAICAYALDEEIIPLDGMSEIAFMLIKPTLDSSRKKAESGSIGGESGLGKNKAKKKQVKSKTKASEKQTECSCEARAVSKQAEREKENEVEIEYKIENELEDKIENDISIAETSQPELEFKPRQSSWGTPGLPDLLTSVNEVGLPGQVKTNNIQTSTYYKPSWFERFWELYPNKIGRIDAMQAWDSIRPDETLCAIIGKAIEKWKKTSQWKDGKIPSPANWLRGGRWTDEVPKEPDPYDYLPVYDRKTGKFIRD